MFTRKKLTTDNFLVHKTVNVKIANVNIIEVILFIKSKFPPDEKSRRFWRKISLSDIFHAGYYVTKSAEFSVRHKQLEHDLFVLRWKNEYIFLYRATYRHENNYGKWRCFDLEISNFRMSNRFT